MGRHTKLTPALTEKIVQAVKVGATDEIAATYAGIDGATYYRWMVFGEKGRSPYREFREAVTQARASCSVADLATISQAAQGTTITMPNGNVKKVPGDWRAAAWRLAVRNPDAYSRRVFELRHTDATGKGPVPVRIQGFDVSKLTPEQLRALAAVDDDGLAGDDPEAIPGEGRE